MKTKLKIEHPLLSIEQLVRLAQSQRLERSIHCGNVALRDLVIVTNLPGEVIVGDTVHGNDRHARPAQIKVGNDSFRLVPLKAADGQIVGRLPVPAERMKGVVAKHPALKEIEGPHESAAALHLASLASISRAGDQPRLLTELLAAAGDMGRALMEQLTSQGLICRLVTETGNIVGAVPWQPSIARGRLWR